MMSRRDVLRVGVIMAGGAGERFWPLSRQRRPKQLLLLTGSGKSLLAEAVDHLLPVISADRLYVVTGRVLADPIRAATLELAEANVLAEPCKRNTSGALAYAAARILAAHPDRSPDAIAMAVTTADHCIGEPERFQEAIRTALDAAERHDALVTCGIVPARPETGFGYIETDDVPLPPIAPDATPVYRVRSFHEKPDAATAQAYVESGRYFWNSGMFFWKISSFLNELDCVRPELAASVRAMADALRRGQDDEADRIFAGLEDRSIDYALMERAANVLLVRGSFPWADIGSWPALATPERTDASGNVLFGDPILAGASGNIVYNALGQNRMAVGVVGVDNLVVVVTEDAVLVVPKDRAQDVREIVRELKSRNAPQL